MTSVKNWLIAAGLLFLGWVYYIFGQNRELELRNKRLESEKRLEGQLQELEEGKNVADQAEADYRDASEQYLRSKLDRLR